jgi:hypothetical protein
MLSYMTIELALLAASVVRSPALASGASCTSRERAPSAKLGSTAGARPHDLHRVGRGDVVVSLQIAGVP